MKCEEMRVTAMKYNEMQEKEPKYNAIGEEMQ